MARIKKIFFRAWGPDTAELNLPRYAYLTDKDFNEITAVCRAIAYKTKLRLGSYISEGINLDVIPVKPREKQYQVSFINNGRKKYSKRKYCFKITIPVR